MLFSEKIIVRNNFFCRISNFIFKIKKIADKKNIKIKLNAGKAFTLVIN